MDAGVSDPRTAHAEARRVQPKGAARLIDQSNQNNASLASYASLETDSAAAENSLLDQGYAALIAPSALKSERVGEGRRAWRWRSVVAVSTGILTLALLPRLYVLFFVSNPQNAAIGWYGDVYHHWQIGYLSKEIGFSHGFLRLWDFKGLEYFWGLLHPLVLAGLFSLTGSVDILIPRLLSVVASSASLTMLFFLLLRHFNLHVALAGLLLGALNPVAVFSDTVGMQEPLGLVFLFAGLLLIRRWPVVSGMLWAIGGMVRAEYWVFGAGLVVAAIVSRLYDEERIPLAIGWLLPSLLYMKYMANYTGNPIYPVYWNFMAGTAGEWIADIPMTPEQLRVQFAARVVLLVSAVAAGWLVVKRPRSLLLLLLGLGNIMMLGIVLGLGEYVRGYISRVLIDRLMVVPYTYVGIFVAVALLYILPRFAFRRLSLVIGWSVMAIALITSQSLWLPILNTYRPLNELWAQETELARQVASFHSGGTISIPEDRQALTYSLVRFHGVTASELEGQMYDPFSYMSGDPFADWTNNRAVVQDWLVGHDIRLLVFYDGKSTYERMIELEPDWFDYEATVYRGTLDIYRVTVSDSSS